MKQILGNLAALTPHFAPFFRAEPLPAKVELRLSACLLVLLVPHSLSPAPQPILAFGLLQVLSLDVMLFF